MVDPAGVEPASGTTDNNISTGLKGVGFLRAPPKHFVSPGRSTGEVWVYRSQLRDRFVRLIFQGARTAPARCLSVILGGCAKL